MVLNAPNNTAIAAYTHTLLGSVSVAGAFLLGIAFAYAADARGVTEVLARLSADPSMRLLILTAAAASLAGMGFHLIRVLRRGREELHRLTSLREAYREERESSLAE